jgi:predicted phage terminase large subunit-like protein
MPQRIHNLNEFEKRMREIGARARQRFGVGDRDLSYLDWLRAVAPKNTWDWKHLLFLYPYLEKIASGERVRLIVCMPPQHGKTTAITERFPAYLMERNPGIRIILGAYNQTRANKYSRANRRIAESRIALSREVSASKYWETEAGGSLTAAGLRGGVTGNPADVIIIDDPIKNRAEAESETIRERIYDCYMSDIRSRLQEQGSIIIILTRWHARDLAGMLIADQAEGRDEWEVISLPALAEENDPLGRAEGEALCPERYSRKYLEDTRATVSAYAWASLYQQRPTPREGGLFNVKLLRYADRAPDGLQWFCYWDLAVQKKAKSSFTAAVAVALGPDGTLWLRDGIRIKEEWPVARSIIKDRMLTDPALHGIEAKLHGVAAVQELLREPELARVPFQPVNVHLDKYTRALPWATRLGQQKVAVVRGTWTQWLLSEMESFPNGAFDDLIDSVSGGTELIAAWSGDVETGDPLFI